jgi:hypothetical protein
MDQLHSRFDALTQLRPTVSRRRHRRRGRMPRRPQGGARLWTIGLVLGWMTAAAAAVWARVRRSEGT